MRRLGCFGMIVIVLAAVIAYQYWKIGQLSSQLASIATKVHSGKAAEPASQQPDLMSALAQAQSYTRRAQDYLKSRNFAQAEADLKKAKQKLDAASTFSKSIYDSSAEFLSKAETRTVKVFNKAWKDISEESPKSKVESQKTKAESQKSKTGSSK